LDKPHLVDDEAIKRAAVCLDMGATVVHPTSTVYGIGSRGDPAVAAEIAKAKRRRIRPLIHLVYDMESLHKEFPNIEWTPDAGRLAEVFWPGPLTIVLADGTATGIAVRIDGHPITRALLGQTRKVLTSTSLNLSGHPPARTSNEVRTVLGEMVYPVGIGGWLDAGDLPISVPSTLVSVREGDPLVLREGVLKSKDIESALGKKVVRHDLP
jgi:L-threonylcarbamoyladenylate synthase